MLNNSNEKVIRKKTTRILAAPFQNKKPTSSQQDKKDSNESNATAQPDEVNFRNHTFTPLERSSQITFDKYVGPTTESNWVIPGVLLVGAYPATQDDEETFQLITSILKLSITKFVCLQQEYQANAPVELWEAGLALRPYYEDVKEIVENKDRFAELEGFNIVDMDKVSFDHCPIVDCGITDDSKVINLAKKLVKDIANGEKIYLHCWGGHGRTGTLVCIMLYLMYGLSAKEAMRRCQLVHDLRTCPVDVGSPQTQTQREQVIRVIRTLERTHRHNENVRLKAAKITEEHMKKHRTKQLPPPIVTSNPTSLPDAPSPIKLEKQKLTEPIITQPPNSKIVMLNNQIQSHSYNSTSSGATTTGTSLGGSIDVSDDLMTEEVMEVDTPSTGSTVTFHSFNEIVAKIVPMEKIASCDSDNSSVFTALNSGPPERLLASVDQSFYSVSSLGEDLTPNSVASGSFKFLPSPVSMKAGDSGSNTSNSNILPSLPEVAGENCVSPQVIKSQTANIELEPMDIVAMDVEECLDQKEYNVTSEGDDGNSLTASSIRDADNVEPQELRRKKSAVRRVLSVARHALALGGGKKHRRQGSEGSVSVSSTHSSNSKSSVDTSLTPFPPTTIAPSARGTSPRQN